MKNNEGAQVGVIVGAKEVVPEWAPTTEEVRALRWVPKTEATKE